jgi:hypothetical protein
MAALRVRASNGIALFRRELDADEDATDLDGLRRGNDAVSTGSLLRRRRIGQRTARRTISRAVFAGNVFATGRHPSVSRWEAGRQDRDGNEASAARIT